MLSSSTVSQEPEMLVPAPQRELEFQDTPWATVECLEQLVQLAFSKGLGTMGTTDEDQWVFHFTREELAKAVQDAPNLLVKSPLLYDQSFHNLKDIWVFCSFDEDPGESY